MIYIYYVVLCVIFALFLTQNLKTQVLTAQQNSLLECLIVLGMKAKKNQFKKGRENLFWVKSIFVQQFDVTKVLLRLFHL